MDDPREPEPEAEHDAESTSREHRLVLLLETARPAWRDQIVEILSRLLPEPPAELPFDPLERGDEAFLSLLRDP